MGTRRHLVARGMLYSRLLYADVDDIRRELGQGKIGERLPDEQHDDDEQRDLMAEQIPKNPHRSPPVVHAETPR